MQKMSHAGSVYAIRPIGKTNSFSALPESWYARKETTDMPLTGYVAHRSEQGKNIFFPDTAASLSALFSGDVSPETPRITQ